MHKGDTIPGIITAGLGIFVVIFVLCDPSMTVSAQSSDGVPGAGFFPFILGLLVAILGVVLLLKGIKEHGTVTYFKIDSEEVKYNMQLLGLVILGLLVFFVLWQVTKMFILCVPIFVFYLNFIFRRDRKAADKALDFKKNLKFNIIYTAVFTIFLYLAFVKAFQVQFDM